MGGWFVHGGRNGDAEMNSSKSHRVKNAGPQPRPRTPSNGKLRMNCTDKPMPTASLPGNWSVFNGCEVLPWVVSRADAAAALRRIRGLRARGQATVSIEAVGCYRLSTFNTIILKTKAS